MNTKETIISMHVDIEDIHQYQAFLNACWLEIATHIPLTEIPGAVVLGFDWTSAFYWHNNDHVTAVKSLLSEQ